MNTKSRVPRADYLALAEFRYQIRRYLRFSEEAARAAGLEPQHHQVLLAIKGAPADATPSIAYLAERLQLRHHSVTGLVNRLARRGLVDRHPDQADLRRVVVNLTPAGEEVLHGLSLVHQDELRSRARALISAMVTIVRGPRNLS